MAGTWSNIAAENRRASAIKRVAYNTAWELLSKPAPKTLDRVPPYPEALTPEFLTAVMCKDNAGAAVTGVTLGVASSGSGDRCAFTVTYNEAGRKAGLPTNLFHKGFNNFYTRLHSLRLEISQNEPGFYAHVQPHLDIETPKPFYAQLEARTYRLTIILDDVIKDKGATFYEVATPIDKDELGQMMGILAKLHGRYWGKEELKTDFPWLLTPTRYGQILVEGMELAQLTHNGFERADSVLPDSLKGRYDEVWNAFLKAQEIATQGPLTYIHGDPHLRNFYRTAKGVVGLADWQVTQRGSWSHDFAYTLITSAPIEMRRAWEKDLLRFYLDKLAAAGGTAPSFDEAWEIYRRQTMYTFVGWLVTIGFGALQPSMQPDGESLEIIRRAAAAIDDLGSLEAING